MTEDSSQNGWPETRPGRRRHAIGTWSGLILSLIVVAVGVFFVDWRETLSVFNQVDSVYVLVALLSFATSFPIFALRWRQLLAVGQPPAVGRLFRFLMIGFLTNAVLPARPGDAVRVALLHRRSGVRLTIGLASLVVERLFDVAVIAFLGLLLSFIVDLPPVILRALHIVAAATFVLLLSTILLSHRTNWLQRLPERYPDLLSGKFARFLIDRGAVFVGATALVASPLRFGRVALLTIAGWLPQAAGVVILLHAFHLPVPLAAGLLVIVTTNLGAVIPSSPGNIGVYHSLAILSLSVWGIDIETALAFAICSHSLAIALHISLGVVCALLEGIGFRGLTALRTLPAS